MQVLIIDTTKEKALPLCSCLKKNTDSEVLCFDSISEMVSDVQRGEIDPDVCFIDLQVRDLVMQPYDSIQLAKLLKESFPGVQIIFTSECDSVGFDVYEVEHIWTLQKPVDPELLAKAWARAKSYIKFEKGSSFSFSFAKKRYQVPLRDIHYFEKDRRRVIMHTTDGNYCFYGRMGDVMTALDQRFLRCHNSYIVNLSKVDSWTKTMFGIGTERIPISRQYAAKAKKAFQNEQR